MALVPLSVLCQIFGFGVLIFSPMYRLWNLFRGVRRVFSDASLFLSAYVVGKFDVWFILIVLYFVGGSVAAPMSREIFDADLAEPELDD